MPPKNRNRIGFVVKDGYPVCNKGTRGVSRNTVKILSLPEAKKWANRIGGEVQEITKIVSVNENGDTYESRLGEDWGTK